MRKIKFFACFVLIVSIFCALAAPASALSDPNINAASVLLVEKTTGAELYSKNADAVIYPASTTKIMTALLCIEAIERGELSLSEMVTAPNDCRFDLSYDASTVGIVGGEIMSLQDLLYCAMIASANEACNVIASRIAGSRAAFVERMNERAKELGCSKTNFVNTHGLHNQNHFTTARDLCLITSEAIKHPLFRELCNTVSVEVAATNLSSVRYLSTTNSLISPYKTAFYYQYASGVKTGFTDEAGYCLISTASKDGLELIAVVMGAGLTLLPDGTSVSASFSESRALYEWAFEAYGYRTLLDSSELLQSVGVRLGDGADSVIIRPAESISALLPSDVETASFERVVTLYSDPLTAPVERGQEVGEISVRRDGRVYGTVKLLANSAVALSQYLYIKDRIVSFLTGKLMRVIIIIVLGLLALWVVYSVFFRRPRSSSYSSRGNYTGRGKRRR